MKERRKTAGPERPPRQIRIEPRLQLLEDEHETVAGDTDSSQRDQNPAAEARGRACPALVVDRMVFAKEGGQLTACGRIGGQPIDQTDDLDLR